MWSPSCIGERCFGMIDEKISKQEAKIAKIEKEIEDKVAEQIRHFGRPIGHKSLSDKLESAKRQLEKLKAKRAKEVVNHPFVVKDRKTIEAIRENRRNWNTSTKGRVSWDNRYSGSRSQRDSWKKYYRD